MDFFLLPAKGNCHRRELRTKALNSIWHSIGSEKVFSTHRLFRLKFHFFFSSTSRRNLIRLNGLWTHPGIQHPEVIKVNFNSNWFLIRLVFCGAFKIIFSTSAVDSRSNFDSEKVKKILHTMAKGEAREKLNNSAMVVKVSSFGFPADGIKLLKFNGLENHSMRSLWYEFQNRNILAKRCNL